MTSRSAACRRAISTAIAAAVASSALIFAAGCARTGGSRGGWDARSHRPYPVTYAQVPPQIDGRLDDAIWAEASPISEFFDLSAPGESVHPATAWLAWDAENLYFAMVVRDEDIYVTTREKDRALYQADVAEVFFKPQRQQRDFYEFGFNVWGAIFDAHYASRGSHYSRFIGFTSNAVVSCSCEGTINDWHDTDTGWTVEAVIPLKAFSDSVPNGPKPVDLWSFNICGCDHSAYRERTLLYCIAPGIRKTFDEYEAYPLMRFVAP